MSTKRQFTIFLSVAALSCGLHAASAMAAEPAGHGHDHAESPAALSLDAGRKWATDAPLRRAMANVRGAMTKSLHGIDAGKFSPAQYDALAKKINDEVAYMVGNCKLEPKADAQLHLIIADLLEGAEVMQGKVKAVKRHDGAVKVLGALQNYGSYFDDPSWQPIKH